MISFETLSLRNFLSYGNNTTVFNLKRTGTTLIVGEDLDNTSNGAGANGVGKSTLINAVTYALYDKPVSDISKDNLVNNINLKNMEVTLEYIGEDGTRYKIHRTRKMKAGAAGNNVYFYINDEDKTLDSAAATNAAIEKTIGVPYELFVRIIVFSAAHNPFLNLKTEEQKDIIEELFGLTTISQKADDLKKIIKDDEAKINIKQAKITAIENELERHDVQIVNARKRVDAWRDSNAATIITLQDKLKKIDGIDFVVQQDLHNTIGSMNKRLSDALGAQRMTERAIAELTKQRNKEETDLKHLRDAKCPYCLQQFTNAQDKIAKCEELVVTYNTELELLGQDLETGVADVSLITQSIKELKAQIVVDDLEDLIKVRNESDNITNEIAKLSRSTNPFNEPLQELLDMKLDKVDYTEINKLARDVEHQKFLLKLLTKKDSFIRKNLVNKNLPFLNSKLQHYLTLLGLPHRVVFTKEMLATISQFGRPLNFGNLSAGQRARVNFALSMAFRDVLQDLHPKINICMLDEVLDIGLDSVGVVAAAKLVKQKAREDNICMFVISHRDEVSSIFDTKMIVQMSKGFSYLVDDVTR